MDQFKAFRKRAHELKDEGNRRFQNKDYMGAMDVYDQALKLTPEEHSDRAILYSNRAACLLQVRPVNYENVVLECTLALEAHPKFGKALFRRARAYEAMGRLQMALYDVQILLQTECYNRDAQELGTRLRLALGSGEVVRQDPQWHSVPPTITPPPDMVHPLSALRAEGVYGLGSRVPRLPASPAAKKKGRPIDDPETIMRTTGEGATPSPLLVSDIPQANATNADARHGKEFRNVANVNKTKAMKGKGTPGTSTKPLMRQLKLIFGHDIRRAEIPTNSGFGQLREVVRKRFPALKAAVIKYQDLDGDLVTITSREELRLAEAEVEAAEMARRQLLDGAEVDIKPLDKPQVQHRNSSLEPLRLHVVEVSLEQEPEIQDDDEMVASSPKLSSEILESTGDESIEVQVRSMTNFQSYPLENQQAGDPKFKSLKREDSQPAAEEMEIDDWLFHFAQLFRNHVGIDPDGLVDFHELGMEVCSEALEAVITSDKAKPLFDAAATKFQEVAALALFNWGNVYMCAARKSVGIQGKETTSTEHLKAAYDWAQGRYRLAGQKYEEALKIKPDFYEGVLALGQKNFESATLQWSAAVASGIDLSSWDSAETIALYCFAEERLETAAEMWSKLEAQRQVEAGSKAQINPLKPGAISCEGYSSTDLAEQEAAMKSQIDLFWGNVLFEHSGVEYLLGLPAWKVLLDSAIEKFFSAGAAPHEVETALKNHSSNLGKDSEGKNSWTRDLT